MAHWYKIDAQASPSATGMTNSTVSVSVDAAAVVSGGVSVLVGDGVSTNIVVTHNIGTKDISVYLYQAASPFEKVIADIERTTTNTVTLRFASAPSVNQYKAVIRPAQ